LGHTDGRLFSSFYLLLTRERVNICERFEIFSRFFSPFFLLSFTTFFFPSFGGTEHTIEAKARGVDMLFDSERFSRFLLSLSTKEAKANLTE
jgi:hypothetical protein